MGRPRGRECMHDSRSDGYYELRRLPCVPTRQRRMLDSEQRCVLHPPPGPCTHRTHASFRLPHTGGSRRPYFVNGCRRGGCRGSASTFPARVGSAASSERASRSMRSSIVPSPHYSHRRTYLVTAGNGWDACLSICPRPIRQASLRPHLCRIPQAIPWASLRERRRRVPRR